MKKSLCHVLFCVDRSGSMSSIASDMIGGYNEFIKKQKEVPGECFVSFYQFDDVYEKVFERVPLQAVSILDSKTYMPRNSTALYDAIGKTITDYGQYLSALDESERPERILFIVITDGMNNASHEYNISQVRDMIKLQTETYKWDFVFLGSNIDAWDSGQSLGISASTTLQFANSSGSVKSAFDSLSKNATSYRSMAIKSNYTFTGQDLKDQDDFLSGELKSKNKQKQKA